MANKKKILEFLQESNGQFSSSRLFMLLVAISAIIDWQHAVWTHGIWQPEWTTIGMVLGVLGFKIAQKPFEEKKKKNLTEYFLDKKQLEEIDKNEEVG